MKQVLVSAPVAAGLLAPSGQLVELPRPAPDARSQEALDAALARARTANEYLIVGRRYRSLRLDRQAKDAVGRADRVATAASEWHAIATSYDALGDLQAADGAPLRAQNALLR